MESVKPEIGVAVIIKKNEQVLLGLRKSSHAEGTWGFPGGKLEYLENPFDCAQRETLEEVGLKLKNLKAGPYTNDIFESGRHFVTLFFVADWTEGEIKLLEPEKCAEWKWFNWNHLPQNLMLPIQNLLKSNFSPFVN